MFRWRIPRCWAPSFPPGQLAEARATYTRNATTLLGGWLWNVSNLKNRFGEFRHLSWASRWWLCFYFIYLLDKCSFLSLSAVAVWGPGDRWEVEAGRSRQVVTPAFLHCCHYQPTSGTPLLSAMQVKLGGFELQCSFSSVLGLEPFRQRINRFLLSTDAERDVHLSLFCCLQQLPVPPTYKACQWLHSFLALKLVIWGQGFPLFL